VIVHCRVTTNIEHSAHLSRVICQCLGYFFPMRFFKHSGIIFSSQHSSDPTTGQRATSVTSSIRSCADMPHRPY